MTPPRMWAVDAGQITDREIRNVHQTALAHQVDTVPAPIDNSQRSDITGEGAAEDILRGGFCFYGIGWNLCGNVCFLPAKESCDFVEHLIAYLWYLS